MPHKFFWVWHACATLQFSHYSSLSIWNYHFKNIYFFSFTWLTGFSQPKTMHFLVAVGSKWHNTQVITQQYLPVTGIILMSLKLRKSSWVRRLPWHWGVKAFPFQGKRKGVISCDYGIFFSNTCSSFVSHFPENGCLSASSKENMQCLPICIGWETCLLAFYDFITEEEKFLLQWPKRGKSCYWIYSWTHNFWLWGIN